MKLCRKCSETKNCPDYSIWKVWENLFDKSNCSEWRQKGFKKAMVTMIVKDFVASNSFKFEVEFDKTIRVPNPNITKLNAEYVDLYFSKDGNNYVNPCRSKTYLRGNELVIEFEPSDFESILILLIPNKRKRRKYVRSTSR
jgi:hypothetical protein